MAYARATPRLGRDAGGVWDASGGIAPSAATEPATTPAATAPEAAREGSTRGDSTAGRDTIGAATGALGATLASRLPDRVAGTETVRLLPAPPAR